MRTFHQLLLESREHANLKQESLGAMVGCTGSYIHLLEKRKIPSFRIASRLEEALKLRRGDLIRLIIETKLHAMIEEAKVFGVSIGISRLPFMEPNGHARSQKNVAQV